MAEPFLAEMRIFGFNFAPRGWAFCNGQILPISQNQPLFALLGTTFGGDGRTSYALPDLRGRTPIHHGSLAGGSPTSLGQKFGEENHSLQIAEIPDHTHTLMGSTDPANSPIPTGRVLADSAPNEIYHAPTSLVPVHAGTVQNTGTGQGHNNMQPFLTLTVCIALVGLFPSRN